MPTSNELPPILSTWSYRKHPERHYVVTAIANIFHRSEKYPVTVIYVTKGYPDRVWARELSSFKDAFTQLK